MNSFVKVFSILILVFASFAAIAEETAVRRFQLPGHGYLQLQVPKVWFTELNQPPNNFPPTIAFSIGTGNQFQARLTVTYSVPEGAVMPDMRKVRRIVEQAANHAQTQAVEDRLEIKELANTEPIGYYFSATDKAPNLGEYKYMTQGMLRVGELASAFTVLTNDGADNMVAAFLQMLRSAVYVPHTP